MRAALSLLLLLTLVASAGRASCEITPDEHGSVASLPQGEGNHWVWVGDRLVRHSILFDGDSGRALGMVDITWTLSGATPYTAQGRNELYVVEPVYTRGHRGKRHDFVTVYDGTTLAVKDEIELPTAAAEVGHGVALAAVLDDERFLVVFNQKPTASVSVADLAARRSAGEIQTAGCALVYPVGPRRFAMLCGDGTAMAVDLGDTGELDDTSKSAKFFDAATDPITEKGVRDGTIWYFASFDGDLHAVDFAADTPEVREPWPLVEEADAEDGWRVGGAQHLAFHSGSRRLYSLVHRGGPGSHKEAGVEIWVYDVDRRERVQRIEPSSLLPAFLRPLLKVEKGTFVDRMLAWILPNLGAHRIVVTQDDRPLLFVRNDDLGALGVMDAMTGEHLRDIEEIGPFGGVISVP